MNEEAQLFSNEPADEKIVGAPDWTKIEAEYRAGKPLRAISAQFGVGKSTISRKANLEGWQRGGTSEGQDAGQTPEKRRTSEVVPPASDDDEDFDWYADDIVVLHEQPRTALYFNVQGGLVIRQENWWSNEELVVIAEECIELFVEKLTAFVGIPSRK